MSHLVLLEQLIKFDGTIYRSRQTAGQRVLLLTSKAVGQCLLERAISIAKRNIDYLGNTYEPALLSRVGHELIFSNGSLVQYAGARPLHNLQKYHAVFWQPLAQPQLATKTSLRAALPANVLAPSGSLIKVSEAISHFYSAHP